MKVEENPKVHAVNVDGTANIIDQCVKHHVKKLVYISSTGAIPELSAPKKVYFVDFDRIGLLFCVFVAVFLLPAGLH